MTSNGVGGFERGGCVVRPGRRLGAIVQRRPEGITGHQWTTASRAWLDFVVYRPGETAPAFAVMFDDPLAAPGDAGRAQRMTSAVCDAVGIGFLRVGSPGLRAERHGRKIVEYVLDARAFERTAVEPDPAEVLDSLADAPGVGPRNYREIVGRLPDGRDGFVNDLGALARAAAIDAYASRRLVDPILRGLHLRWKDGTAEGWAWLDVSGERCLFERVTLSPRAVSCGIDPGRLAEDLAAMAVGERLTELEADDPHLRERDALRRDVDGLRRRRAEMIELSDIDHISI